MYLLKQAGYAVSGETDNADAVIINTCGFIDSAKTEAINTILELANAKSGDAGFKIIVAGCLAERYKDELQKELPEVDAIVGVGSFDEIADVVRRTVDDSRQDGKVSFCKSERLSRTELSGKEPRKADKETRESFNRKEYFSDINAPVSETVRVISTSKVWAYLKIAEGCDNRCAYCVIPDIRGRFRSRPIDMIVKEAKELAGRGYKELNIVAQDLTAYGLDLYGKRSLTELLQAMSDINELKWIRLFYLHPHGIDSKLIKEIARNDKIVKYLDIPIQHINTRILEKMNRRVTRDDIQKLFDAAREGIDNVVLRSSIITGLPYEDNKAFDELCAFLEEAKIERAGVFAYSPQENTPAAKMKRVSAKIAQQRCRAVQEIQSKIMHEFDKSHIGKVFDAIIEEHEDENALFARSYAQAPEVDGYIKIKKNAPLSGFYKNNLPKKNYAKNGKSTTKTANFDKSVNSGKMVKLIIADIQDGQLIGEIT